MTLLHDLWRSNVYWAVWLAATLVFFGVREAVAIGQHRLNDTLSRWLRRILGIAPSRWWHPIGIAVFAGGLLTLAIHICTRWL